MPMIVIAVAVFRPSIIGILILRKCQVVGIVCFVEAMRPGPVTEHAEALTEAMIHRQQQPIVVGGASGICQCNGPDQAASARTRVLQIEPPRTFFEEIFSRPSTEAPPDSP